jgi:LysM repeat protein
VEAGRQLAGSAADAAARKIQDGLEAGGRFVADAARLGGGIARAAKQRAAAEAINTYNADLSTHEGRNRVLEKGLAVPGLGVLAWAANHGANAAYHAPGAIESATNAVSQATTNAALATGNAIEAGQRAGRRELANFIWNKKGATVDSGVAKAAANLSGHLDQAGTTVERAKQVVARSRKELPQHTVKAGETLAGLAEALNRDWKDIYELNKQAIGPDPNRLTPGTRLRMPTKRDEATAKAEGQAIDIIEQNIRQAEQMQAELNRLGQ